MTILGVDWGERRVGVAISDPVGIIAVPLTTLEVTSDSDAITQLQAIVVEKECDSIVVGMPVNMDGTIGPIHDKAESFMKQLGETLGITVSGWDERLSSMAADSVLNDAQMDNRDRKGVRDRVAAQIILQNYLDSI